MAKKWLFGHTDFNSAYEVDDYPYGFNQRTKLRAWIETKPKKGDRFVTVTLNPKTGRWNKPKASTFASIGAMYLDNKGHIQWDGVSQYSDEKEIRNFVKEIGGEKKLNKDQLKMYKELVGEDEGEIKWKHKFFSNFKGGDLIMLDITFDVANRLKTNDIINALDEIIKKEPDKFKEVLNNDGGIRIFGRKGTAFANFKADKFYQQIKSKLKNKIRENKMNESKFPVAYQYNKQTGIQKISQDKVDSLTLYGNNGFWSRIAHNDIKSGETIYVILNGNKELSLFNRNLKTLNMNINENKMNEARKWKEFKDLKVGDEFYFDPKDKEKWVKNSSKTVKLLSNNRKFYASPDDIVYIEEAKSVSMTPTIKKMIAQAKKDGNIVWKDKEGAVHQSEKGDVLFKRAKRVGDVVEILYEAKKSLSVPEKHQLKIAKQTLKYSDAGAMIMGGMTKEQARSFLKKVGYSDKEIAKLEENKIRETIRKMIREEILKEWKWSDPEFKDAKLIYHGDVFTDGSDYFFTVKDKKLWKFENGVNDTKNPPFVKFIKKVNNIKFPSGDNDVEYNGKELSPIGKAALYKLKNNKIVWEY